MNYKSRIARSKLSADLKRTISQLLAQPESVEDLPKRKQIEVIQVLREYYTNSKELLPDSHYDVIEDIVKDMQPRNKIWKQVGAAVPKGRIEVKLPVYMPSMDKIKPGTPKLTKFLDPNSAYTIMDKLDGISLQVVYEKGVCVQAATRGDGTVGQDVSHWIPYLRIPKRIPIKTRFIARAEAIVKTSTFDTKHDKTKNTKGTFKAARNMAGGVLNKLSGSKDFKQYQRYMRDIDVVFYEVQQGRTAGGPISKQLQLLKKLKFTTVWHITTNNFIADDPSNSLSQIYNNRIENSPYEIDGIIVAKDVTYTPQKAFAKHAAAFKENSEAAMKVVPVKSVDWEISRNNIIVPTISIDPIRLGGVTVSNFLAHSLFYVQNGFKKADAKKNLKQKPINVGAQIKVVRSGGVIPYIVEVVKPARKAAEPPFPYKVKGVHAVSTSKGGESRAKKLTHFFVTLGLEGFKQSTFEKLIALGYNTPRKVMRIKPRDLKGVDGWADKSIRDFTSRIAEVTTDPTFVDFCVASGYMPSFGKERVQKIVDEYGDDVLYWEDAEPEDVQEDIEQIKGFKKLAGEFAKSLPRVFKLASNLNVELVIPEPEQAQGNEFEGQRITFTGVRDKDLARYIEQQGGKVQSMKSDTTILVIKDESYTSSKVDKAENAGIPVMTLDEFKSEYGI